MCRQHQSNQLGGSYTKDERCCGKLLESSWSYIPTLRPGINALSPHLRASDSIHNYISFWQDAKPWGHGIHTSHRTRYCSKLKVFSSMTSEIPGEAGSVRNNSEVKEQKRTYEERQLRQWNCRIIIWEQKPRTTNAIVYDSIRSVERNSEKQLQFSLTWFVLISEHTSGYPQYFPLTEGNFWNTAKCKTTFSTKPNPEVYNPLAAYFREFKGRSKGNPKKRECYEKTSL